MPEDNEQTKVSRDDLVAYLDGELDESRSRDVEQELAANSALRQDVELLTRTWEMLDRLPRAKVPAEFTERTVATMKAEKTKPTVPHMAWKQHARRGMLVVVWGLALIISALFGFRLMHRRSAQTELLLNELPVIQDLDIYSEIGNVEFLQQLRESGLFQDDVPSEQN